MENETSIVVVGAGIAGIGAAIYLKRSNVPFLLLEKGAPGGKLNNIHRIDNYAGFDSVSGPELATDLLRQVSSLGISIEYANVTGIEKSENGFHLHSDVGDIRAKAVILANGLGGRAHLLPGEKEHIGRGVSYCATCDGAFFKNKEVAVLGFEDHAVEDALYLSNIASRVYFIAEKPIHCAENHAKTLYSTPNIEVIESAKVLSIEGETLVSGLSIENEKGKRTLFVSGVFPLYGEAPAESLFANLGLKSEKGFLLVDDEKRTSVPGVFAAGDIVCKKLRQLITAASDGAIAATSALNYIRSISKN